MSLTLADLGVIMLTSGFSLAVLVQLICLVLFKIRSESVTYWFTLTPIILGLAGVIITVTGLALDGPMVHYIGNWFGNEFYQYHLSIAVDLLAVTYACLTLLLLGLIAVSSQGQWISSLLLFTDVIWRRIASSIFCRDFRTTDCRLGASWYFICIANFFFHLSFGATQKCTLCFCNLSLLRCRIDCRSISCSFARSGC